MKHFLTLGLIFLTTSSFAQENGMPTLKSILLEQLKTTHNVKDWFVPASDAIAGLSPEQANWKDSTENHSIAQLTTHLIFWNMQMLEKIEGRPVGPFDGNNKETFRAVNNSTWKATVQKLDSVLNAWEDVVARADDAKLKQWYSTIAHIGTHNAYHTGQIIYIRKMNGWWDADKGVK